jgi:outer membrane receptor protein involved in Fe transport
MFTNSKLAKSVRLAMVVGAASTALTLPNFAAAQEAGSVETIEKISVTGSRIKRTDLEGSSPVQVIMRADLILSGITNIGDILQELPAVAGAGTNTSVNNGGSGAVRVSLRGLGSERTLVLLNGRRMPASGSGANASVDLSTIPTAIIERIEVLTDGASAIYGSDAIGGVVNIITRKNFNGFEFNASYDIGTEESDGDVKTIDFTVGAANDKASVVFSAYYSEQGEQWSGDRDWSAFEFDMDETGEISKGGSSAPPWSRLNGIDGQVNGEACSSFTHGAANGPGQSDPTQFTNPTGYKCWDWDVDTYNYAPANYHLTPSERYGIFSQVNYEFNDNLRFFSEISFNRRESTTLLAPLPLAPLPFFGWGDAPYSADNYYNETLGPVNTAGETVEIADWRRRVVETGGRNTSFQVDTIGAVFGFEGDIDDNWAYEVSFNYGRNDGALARQGGVNFERVSNAVGPSFLNDLGDVVCGTVDNPIAGCVSLNIFGIPGTDTEVSSDMLDYISFEAHDQGFNEHQIISASVFGDLFELPAGPVGVAFGVEHRSVSGADLPDALISLGITSGTTRKKTEGSYEVDEIYVETNVPIINDVPGIKMLSIDGALRYSDYNTFGDTTNYKLGIKYMPTEDVIVRASSSSAFRAPTIPELFLGASDNSPTVVDPCSTNPSSFCIADGVPAAGFEPIGDQLSSTRGGNATLTPEEADTLTVGIVYSPQFVEGLSITVDYWSTEITNAISTVGEQLILDSCAATGLYCEQITRFGADSLLYGNSVDISDTNVNVGGIDSSGFDFNARYNTDISWGSLSVNLDSTRYDSYEITQADGSVADNAGFFKRNSGDGNFPEWRTNLTATLRNNDWSASWAIRYIGEVEEQFTNIEVTDLANVNSAFRVEEVIVSGALDSYDVTRTIDEQVIHDLRFTYFMDNLTTTVGLNNVFDEDPPYAATGFNDNTDPRTYDTQGRHIYVSFGMAF